MNRKQFFAILVFTLLSFSVLPVGNVVATTRRTSTEGYTPQDLSLREIMGMDTPSMNEAINKLAMENTNSPRPTYRVDEALNQWIRTGNLPKGIYTINDKPSILLLVRGDDPSVNGLVNVVTYLPIGTTGYTWVHGTVDNLKNLKILATNPNVLRVDADLSYKEEIKVSSDFVLNRDRDVTFKPGDITPNNYKTRDIIGVNVAEALGYNGTGITVDVQDTGVDFGHTALIGTMQTTADGNPASLEATGIGMSLSSLFSYNYYMEYGLTSLAERFAPLHTDADGFINITGYTDDLIVFASDAAGLYTLASLGLALPDFYYVGDLPGNSTGYAFGVSMIFNAGAWTIVPFLLADANDDGNYDTLYIDFETGFYMSKRFYNMISEVVFFRDAPFNFSIQAPHTNTNDPYLSKDILSPEGFGVLDGYRDISIGGLGNTFDVFNFTGRLGLADPFVRGIDPSGVAFAHIWDYHGHGTAVSGNIAAQDVGYELMNNGTLYSIRGMAPGAKIIGTPGLSDSAIMYGWIWALGYEADDTGLWNFVGDHVANISSNSWGSSPFELGSGFVQGYDITSLLVDLLSPPGSIGPNHPGGIFVIAAGNGGPGIGTISSPANSIMAISVGASTNFWYFENSSRDEAIRNWGPGQGYDQVISWSNNGPTTIAYPKVDVVNIGAYDYSIVPTSWQTGGYAAYGVFGGTSEATPMTSGALATILQAYNDLVGQAANISIAKTLLKSTATDLGYDVYMQGAGRVDVARAIYYLQNGQLPNGEELFFVHNGESIPRASQFFAAAFKLWFGENGSYFPYYHPELIDSGFAKENMAVSSDLWDTGVYGGYLLPGESVSTDVIVEGASAPASLTPYTFETIYSDTVNQTEGGQPLYTTTYYNNYTVYELFNETALQNADYFQISVAYEPKYFNWLVGNGSYAPIVYFINWNDDGDGVLETLERQNYDLAYSDYHIQTMFVSTKILSSTSMILVRDNGFYDLAGNDPAWPGFPFTISVRAFKRVMDTRVTITDNGSGNYTVDISIEGGATPGQYEGFVAIEGTNGGYALIPYSYSVMAEVMNYATNGWTEISGLTNRPNDNAIYSAIDWGWREESGDYRFYQFMISGADMANANTLAVEVEWTYPGTTLDVWVVDYDGRVVAKSDINYISGGKYLSVPNAPPNIQRLLVNITDYRVGNTLTGGNFSDGYNIFTLAMHATAVDYRAVPVDPISIRIAWVSDTIDAFTVPTPTLTTPVSTTLNGIPITNSYATVTWDNVSTNPIPEFANAPYPTKLTASSAKFLIDDDTISSDELVPYSNSIVPERIYEVYLEAGMVATGTLDWDNSGTDFDLLLIRKGDTIAYSRDVWGGQASTLSKPETASAVVPATGFYWIVIEYFDGDGSPQHYWLEFSASKKLTEVELPGPGDLTLDFVGLGAPDGSYLLESRTFGWNFDYKFSSPIYLDTGAPTIVDPNFVIPEFETSGNWTVGKFTDATPYNITVTFKGKTIYEGVNVQGFTDDIVIDIADVDGYLKSNYLYVYAVDFLGNVLDTKYAIIHDDTTRPKFDSKQDDITVEQNTDFDVVYIISDATNGTWTLELDSNVVADGTWLPGTPVVITLNIADVGTYEYTFTATDFTGRSRSDTFIVTVTPAGVTTTAPGTTAPPAGTTSQPSETTTATGGGFLPFPFVSALTAFAVVTVVVLRKRKY